MGGFMVMARRQASLVPNVISKIGDIQILFANRVKFLGSSSGGRVEREVVPVRLTQANVEAAARSVAISLATPMRRQREPEFQKALRQA